MRDFLKYIPLFLLVILLQVYVLDNVAMPAMVRPVVFFYILMVLPEMPQWIFLLVGFATGIIMDSFDHTPGVNAAACVMLAYSRDFIVRFLKPIEQNDIIRTHIRFMGFRSFLNYAIIMSVIYHFISGFLGYFTFNGFWFTVLRILLNAIVSVLLIFVFDIIFFYRRSKTD